MDRGRTGVPAGAVSPRPVRRERSLGDASSRPSRARCRAMALTLPIFETPPDDLSVTGLRAYVEAFMDAERVPPAIVVGNSLGGHVALRPRAPRAWSACAGSVLSGSSGLFERSFTRGVPHRPSAEFVREKMTEVFHDPAMVTPEWVEEIRDRVSRRSYVDAGARRSAARPGAATSEDRLGEIRCPTPPASGARRTGSPRADVRDPLPRRYPIGDDPARARVRPRADARAPEAFARAVDEFLDTCRPGGRRRRREPPSGGSERPLAWLAGRRLRQMEAVWRDPLQVQERALRAMVAAPATPSGGGSTGSGRSGASPTTSAGSPIATYLDVRPSSSAAIRGERDVLWPGRPARVLQDLGDDRRRQVHPGHARGVPRAPPGRAGRAPPRLHRVGRGGPRRAHALPGRQHPDRARSGAMPRWATCPAWPRDALPAWIRGATRPGPEIAAIPGLGAAPGRHRAASAP